MSLDPFQIFGLATLAIMILGSLFVLIHITMGFEEFFDTYRSLFTRNRQEYLRKRDIERQKRSSNT